MGTRYSCLALSCLSVFACASSLGAQPVVPTGPEFRVNTFTYYTQNTPSLAMDGGGDFVVVWQSYLQDGSKNGVFGQRFTSAGARQGAEFQVNSYTTYTQDIPKVAMDADGDFVVVWTTPQDGYGYSFGVFAQRFASSGAKQGLEFMVNTYTSNTQNAPTVAMDGDGDFVVTWSSSTQDGNFGGVFAQRFDATGAPQGAEFQVNSFTPTPQELSAVAMDEDGNFVIAWNSANGQDGNGHGVFARRFDSAGVPQATEFQVNSRTSSSQALPSVAMDADGDFVVAWEGFLQDGNQWGVFAQRFNAAGAPQGVELQVNSYTPDDQRNPAVDMSPDGGFVVAWNSSGQDGEANYDGVFGRRFDSAGTPQAAEFRVNTYTPYSQALPTLALDADGGFVIAWNAALRDSDNSSSIFAQRFGVGAVIDTDGNGAKDPLTDGLLILRYKFGFTANALIAGAVAMNCTRCDGPAIITYLDSLGLTLDVDQNGVVEPLTDALLIVRFLFGFTGNALIGGAVAPNCMRCDAPMIEAYLQTLN